MSHKDFTRREGYEPSGEKKSGDKKDHLRTEVEKLSKKGFPLRPSDIMELHKKYPHDESIIDEILRLHAKRYAKIRKYARRVAEKIQHKYSDGSRPLHEILNRMLKYKTDQGWSDMEYSEFAKELSDLLSGKKHADVEIITELIRSRSRINRALGYRRVDEGTFNIKESEHGVLAEILSMYQKSMTLHKSVFMQSIMYGDCDILAISGEFDKRKHITANHIHPVIAMMFLPKFEIFEYHMLYSNIGRIIKCRKEGKPVLTEPDSLLFYDLTTDPNDVVCDTDSAITDLKNRFIVQIKLWQIVQNLRAGKYYEDSPISEFILALNECRNNLYDSADLAYNQDEGAIIRRLLSVFSLRPIMIVTQTISTLASYFGNYAMGMGMGMGSSSSMEQSALGHSPMAFNNEQISTITSISLISVHIPLLSAYNKGSELEPVNFNSSMGHTIWINENKTIIPKKQQVVHCNEVMIFYVNRRVQNINIRSYMNPLQFSHLPLTLNSFSRINKYPVEVLSEIPVLGTDELFHLRSVVAVMDTEISQVGGKSSIITGCVGLFARHRIMSHLQITDTTHHIYDPIGAGIPTPKGTDEYIMNKPISNIPYYNFGTDGTNDSPGFLDMASKQGTIYIYAKPTGYVGTRNMYISV